MTQPAPQQIRLPPPVPPVTTRVVSLAPFPNDTGAFELLVWQIGQANPLVRHLQIVRMIPADGGGVDVYCLSADGRDGVRYYLSKEMVRLVEEQMPAAKLVEEIVDAESDDDDPDEVEENEENEGEGENEDEGNGAPDFVTSAPNGGQPTS